MNVRYLAIALAGLVVLAMWHLRDPSWLATHSSGMKAWQMTDEGIRARWAGSSASFFIPADVRSFELPLRDVKDEPADRPITVTIRIDDRPVSALTLADESWHVLKVPVPEVWTSRRFRRVDVKLDRLRVHHRGIQVGEPKLVRAR